MDLKRGIAHKLGYGFGRSRRDACWIGFRYDPAFGFRNQRMDSWLTVVEGDEPPRLCLRHVGRLGQPWRSASGTMFVPSYEGTIYIVHPLGDAAAWTLPKVDAFPVGGVMLGAYGLADDHVFVWGERNLVPFMVRWDGRKWHEMPSPSQHRVWNVVATAPDFVFAVGDKGLIAHFDGTTWRRLPCAAFGNMSNLAIVDRDEVYACGYHRRLLEGSAFGFSEILISDVSLSGLAKRDDTLWVSSWEGGLNKLVDGHRLEQVNEDISIASMCGHGEEMIFSTEETISFSTDGKDIFSYDLSLFMRLLSMEGDRFGIDRTWYHSM